MSATNHPLKKLNQCMTTLNWQTDMSPRAVEMRERHARRLQEWNELWDQCMSAKGVTPPEASTFRRTPTEEDYKRGWYYRTEADELNRAAGYDGGIRTVCRKFTTHKGD